MDNSDLNIDTGGILQSGNQRSTTPSTIRQARQERDSILSNTKSILGKASSNLDVEIETLQKFVDTIDKLKESKKEADQAFAKRMIKTAEYKETVNLLKDMVKIQGDLNRIETDNNTTAEEAIKLRKDYEDLLLDSQYLIEKQNTLYDLQSKKVIKVNDEIKKGLAYTESSINKQKSVNVKNYQEAADVLKEANKSMLKATGNSLSNFSKTIRSLKDSFNLDKIAQNTERSSKSQLEEQLLRAYDMSKKDFKNFKRDISDSFNTSLYSSAEVMKVYGDLLEVGLGNDEDAKQNFSTLLKGQSLLGMTAENQQKLLSIGNRLGRDQLQFTTNQVAKYLKTATNLSKQQLNELVTMNANFTDEMADLGVDSAESQATDLATGVAMTDYFKDGGAFYGTIQSSIKEVANDFNKAASYYGLEEGELYDKLNSGIDIFSLGLQSTTGLVKNYIDNLMYNWDDARANRQKYTRESGLDSSTAKVYYEYVKQLKENNVNLQDLVDTQKAAGADANSKSLSDIEQTRDAALSSAEKLKNIAENKIFTEIDWIDADMFSQNINLICGLLETIAGILTASSFLDMFKGKGTNSMSGNSSGGLLNTLKSVGGPTNVQNVGIGKFTGAGTWLGGSTGINSGIGAMKTTWNAGGGIGQTLKSGLSASSYGNGIAGAVSKGVGILGVAQTAMDAVGGATTLANKLYTKTDENGNTTAPTAGDRVKGALMGAFSGTKIETDKNGEVSVGKNAAMGALSGAGKGAAIGSFFGPLGTAIGGGLGAIAGGISGWFKGKKAKEQEDREKAQLKAEQEQLKKEEEIAQNTAKTKDALNSATSLVLRDVRSARATGGPIGSGSPSPSQSAIQTSNPSRALSENGVGGLSSGKKGEYLGPWLVTSPYGAKRTYTNTQGKTISDIHSGIDLAKNGKQPIYAGQAGKVSYSYSASGGGNQISITGSDGKRYLYCHMDGVALKSGDVIPGQFLGMMGSTGNVTGQHLHFGVYSGGKTIDPVSSTNDKMWDGDKSTIKETLYSGKTGGDISSGAVSVESNLSSQTNRTNVSDKIKNSYSFKVDSLSQVGNPIGAPTSMSQVLSKDDSNNAIVKKLDDVINTLIELSDRQTFDEKIMSQLQGRQKQEPKLS